ncbi:MAG: DNA polymerase III subunit delta [Hespellia sp.]|nr:DNA polymerase III subunit delta [Hespellia sp.]
MKSLNEDLKTGQFKQIYLLYGEENYLKKQYKDRLTKAMIPEGDTMNYSYFEGKGVEPREVIDLSETMPFFADRRLLVFENTGFFKTASPELADYLKELPETSYFLFVENEIDKRGKLYKTVKDKGRIVELPLQDENTLKRWILGAVKRENKQISERSILHFLEKTGTDMGNIQGELEKLFCYTLEKSDITEADIDAVCVTQISNKIFDMVNAVADRRQRRALELYYDLLALKEPSMRILYLMTRQFRILMEVKDLMKHGFGRKEIASKAGLHPFAAGKYMEQAKSFKTSVLRGIIEESADIEERVKTGLLTDNIAVEVFIVKYSQP